VDVAIVGAGITGVTAALLLKRAGKRVAVLEMDRIGAGETGNTTAHSTVLLDAGYATLRKRFGDDGAKRAAESQQVALDTIAELVRQEQIACDFLRVPTYLYCESPADMQEIDDEIDSLKRVGFDVARVRDVPLPFPVHGGLRLEGQLQLHALRYVDALARRVHGDGCSIHEGTRVTRVEPGEPCVVHTSHGQVRARDVLYASHAPINWLKLHTKIEAYRSYVLAVRTPNPPPYAQYYDTMNPYHYLRNHPYGDGSVLIIGGEDHRTGAEQHTEEHYAALEQYARERFGEVEVVHAWSGQILEPADGLPFIGKNPGDEHIYVSTGYSGTGISNGTLGAILCTDAILHRDNPWAELYSPSRFKPLAQLRGFVSQNADVPAHLVGDRLKAILAHGDVSPGQGRVMRHEGHTLAVYHDEQGQYHLLSPVCPHMGCYVQWNDGDKSWDCPCHGSRFSATGTLINGPAVDDLHRHGEAPSDAPTSPKDEPHPPVP
ncbi:MAG TPA: FAD-dependent oxidoreductase, partial [Myxococcota bacterium]|nr:FAD-dependent oxidoreductase [Myxococcota bacterium]